MTYVKKFEAKYKDRYGVTYRIDLSLLGGTAGHETITYLDPEPVKHTYINVSKEAAKIVYGSQLTFSFYSAKDDITDYDVFAESEYRDWLIAWYKDTDLIFKGYLQPDNINRGIFEGQIKISLSATDGIKDLSQTEFRDALGAPHEGTVPIIEAIKLALTPLELDYNFLVKLNTHETTVTPTSTCLNYGYVDLRRFNRLIDGRNEVDSCLTVIEKLLFNFNVRFFTYKGLYYIQNHSELNSINWTINWTTLAVTSDVAATDIVNIDDYKFQRSGTLSSVSPVKILDLKHLNRNIGDNLIPYLNTFEGINSPWTIDFKTKSVSAAGLAVTIIADKDNPDPDYLSSGMELTSTFEVEKLTDNDYIIFSFNVDAEITSDDPQGRRGALGTIELYIIEPDGTETVETIIYDNRLFTIKIPVFQTGNYKVGIRTEFSPGFYYSVVNLVFNNFQLRRGVEVDGELTFDITFDKLLRFTSTVGKRKVEQESVFGDSGTSGDLGRFVLEDSGDYTGTALWKRYGKTESQSILALYAQNHINQFSKYVKYYQLTIRDTGNITPDKIIQIGTVNHVIESYEDNSNKNFKQLRIRELVTTDVSTTLTVSDLTSVDGQSKTPQTAVIPFLGGGNTDVFVESSEYPTLDKLLIRQSGVTRQITLLQRSNAVLSGGNVVWSGSGFLFYVSPALFIFDGKIYQYPGGSVTLDTPHATLDRIDVLALKPSITIGNEPLLGAIEVVKGIDAAIPVKPFTDRETQLELTYIGLTGGTTIYGSDQEVVYDENVEWTVSSDATVDANSTTFAFSGTKSISVPAVTGKYLQFLNTTTVKYTDYDTLSFHIKLATVADFSNINVYFYNDGNVTNQPYPIQWMLRGTTDWQFVSVPLAEITRGNPEFDAIRIEYTGNCPAHYIDFVQLSGGIEQAPVLDIHPRTHDMDSPFDHKPVGPDDYGKSPVANATTGVWELQKLGAAIDIPVPKVEIISHNEDPLKDPWQVYDKVRVWWEQDNKEFLNHNPELWIFRRKVYERVKVSAETTDPAVGASFGGGKFVQSFTMGGKKYGLIVATADAGSAQYGCRGTVTGATGEEIGTGADNTTTILAECATRPIQASLADGYTEGGKSDWHLPSVDEMGAVYTNRASLGSFSDFNATSTEVSNNNFYGYWFTDGSIVSDSKDVTYSVRAVRYELMSGVIIQRNKKKKWVHEPHNNGSKFVGSNFYGGKSEWLGKPIESEFALTAVEKAKQMITTMEYGDFLFGQYFRSGLNALNPETMYTSLATIRSRGRQNIGDGIRKRTQTLGFAIVIDNPDPLASDPKLIGIMSRPIELRPRSQKKGLEFYIKWQIRIT